MKSVTRLVARLPNYVHRFGLFAGLRLHSTVELDSRSHLPQLTNRLRVPGFAEPLFLRQQRSDRATFWQCIVKQQYDLSAFPQRERLMASYSERLRNGEVPVIVDGGANIGLATRSLALIFPEAQFVAVEPDPENVAILERNLLPLGSRATILQGALWNESTRLNIVNPEAGSAALRVGAPNSQESGSVRAYTIDEICARLGVPAPFIVKLDIEGSQAALFKSATEWVSRTPLIMLELDDWLMPWQGTSRPFFSCLSQYPFDYLIGGETIFCFRDFAAPPTPPTLRDSRAIEPT
jgi:FkbM family methyltransferase